jgi:hypothetical protein
MKWQGCASQEKVGPLRAHLRFAGARSCGQSQISFNLCCGNQCIWFELEIVRRCPSVNSERSGKAFSSLRIRLKSRPSASGIPATKSSSIMLAVA